MTGLQKLLTWKAANGQGISVQDATATGNPVTFSTTLARPLVSCEAAFLPVQEGTGDPSPDNVREISGWTGIEVYHSGSDTGVKDTFPVSWQTEAGTVYGGTLDVTTGELVVEWGYLKYTGDSSENWNVENQSNFYIMTPTNFKRVTNSSTLICNMAKSSNNVNEGECRITTSGNFNIKIGTLIGVTTVSAFKEWLSQNNVEIAVSLTEPLHYIVTPEQITTFGGTNNIWSNANGDLTVTYKKKG